MTGWNPHYQLGKLLAYSGRRLQSVPVTRRYAISASHIAEYGAGDIGAESPPAALPIGWARVDAGQYDSSVQIGAFGASNPRASPTGLAGRVVVRQRVV